MQRKPKLLVIVGPTASGKSSLSVEIAKKYDGEITSADSRQVYKGLDIATGKITSEEKQGVPHHLLDVASSHHQFSVAEYKALADKSIHEIHERGNMPILVGGTGFYIQAVVDDLVLPEVPPNTELRKKLSHKTTDELFKMIKNKDPKRAHSIEPQNPRRLIRALEIIEILGHVPDVEKNERFDTLQIGLHLPLEELVKNIHARTQERMQDGMLEEAKRLKKEIGLERMRELGLEYRDLADYLEGVYTEKELEEKIIQSDAQYAKKQMRWFNKDKRIQWFDPRNKKNIFEVVEMWINN